MSPLRPLLAALLALGLLGLYAWDKTATEARAVRNAALSRVLVADVDAVRRLTIEMPDATVSFARESDRWMATEPERFRADTGSIEAFLGNIVGSRRQSPFPTHDLATYGLDNPKARVTLELQGAAEPWTLEIGSQPGALGRIYARIAGEDTVFGIGEWVAAQATRPLANWRDLALAEPSPQADEWRLTSPRGAVRLFRDDARWMLERPTTPLPADGAMVEQLATTFAQARLRSLVESDTTTYTLAARERPLLIVSQGTRELLRIADRDDRTRTWIVQREDGSVGVVPHSVLTPLLRQPLEWGTKRLVLAAAEDFRRIESTSGNSRLDIELEAGAWRFRESPDMALNPKRAERLVATLVDLRAVKLAAESIDDPARLRELSLHQPALTLRVTKASGEVEGFDVGTTDPEAGVTWLRRVADGSVWGIDFRQATNFYKFNGDLQERRLFPEAETHTTRIVVESGTTRATLQREGEQWRVQLGNRPATMIPHAVVEELLTEIGDLEFRSQVLGGGDSQTPTASLRLFKADAKEPYDFLEVLGNQSTANEGTIRTARGIFTVASGEYQAFIEALATIVQIAVADNQADKGRRPR